MYIDYEKIGLTLRLFFPKYSKEISDFCYKQKVRQNCGYIAKNQKKIRKILRKKIGRKPLKVVFYVYETSRWKSQSIYDLMLKNENFEPVIVVTKNCSGKENFNYQSIEEIKQTYNFFKERNMNVEFGYDIEKDCYIPLKKFKPDLIFYSHPWYVYKTQGPVMCSKFALTYYVPYFLPNTSLFIEYGLRFHQYVNKYYVLNNLIKDFYHNKQELKSNNLVPVGHPQLDHFYLSQKTKDKKTVIYAPHWSIGGVGNISYSTFSWSGDLILNFAKSHPEINWVFKPHPLLAKQLVKIKFLSEKEVENYYNEWKSIAKYYDSGDYLNLFDESYAMITDCGSFLTEYLLTEQPVIHLVSDTAVEYNDCVKKIVKSYYQARNIDELSQYLDEILIKKNDPKKQERLSVLKELELENNYCAQRIIDDIIEELHG